MGKNNIEQIKERMVKGPWYTIISPGNTEGHGGVLFSPFFDNNLIGMWLELNELSRDNFMVFKVTEIVEEDDMSHNFTKETLDSFIERIESMAKEDWYEHAELFEKFKEHCKNVLGKDISN